MIEITDSLSISESEVEISAVRSQGAGGQNVNKVSTAAHLRFDIEASSLPFVYKNRLKNLKDKRITKDGIIIIKAQSFRTQEKNREDAIYRLAQLIKTVTIVRKNRKATKIPKSSKKKRLDNKSHRSKLKTNRKKPGSEY